MPPDFRVGFGAEAEEQARAFKQLQLMLILAIILVYAVMASQYESLRDPFIIMFSVPLAAIGVVLALKLTGTTFSLQAYIGVIMLAGIVVSNAILLVDYTNILRRRDHVPLREAVETAGRTRLRPILMTSLATMLGLVPMALGIGEGAELQAPLARVVIGGLLASTLITLVFVPMVYTHFRRGLEGAACRAPAPSIHSSATCEGWIRHHEKTDRVRGDCGGGSGPPDGRTTPSGTARSRRRRPCRSAAADVVEVVQATGTLQAVTTVNVGTQVSGVVQELYRRLQPHRPQGTGDCPPRPLDPPGADRVAGGQRRPRQG